VEIFRGAAADGGYGVSPSTLVDAQGHRVSIIHRPLTTFEAEQYIVRRGDVARLSLPLKARMVALIDGRVIVQLADDWKAGSGTIPSGAIAAFDLAAMRDPAHLNPVTVFEPGARESVNDVTAMRDRLLVGLNRNVQGKVLSLSRKSDGTWTQVPIALPANVSTNVLSVERAGNRAFVGVTGYLTPSSVWLADAVRATAVPVKTDKPRFDASQNLVEQLEATSKDGTRIPYFDNPLRLWRVRDLPDAAVQSRCREALAGTGWRIRRREHPGRRGVRPRLARGRAQDPSSGDL
jgi:prolyl oligopeptidase